MDQRYLTIVRWGKNLGSMKYYIDRKVQQAIRDNAPQSAIYKKDDGSWEIAENISCDATRKYILTGGN